MSKQTITICNCDVCGMPEARPYKTLAYRTFDANDGRTTYAPPRLEQVTVDLCDDCARSATNLHSIGVCCEQYEIKKGTEDYDRGFSDGQIDGIKEMSHIIIESLSARLADKELREQIILDIMPFS